MRRSYPDKGTVMELSAYLMPSFARAAEWETQLILSPPDWFPQKRPAALEEKSRDTWNRVPRNNLNGSPVRESLRLVRGAVHEL